MNQISIAICDADSAYGNKLAEYLLETGNVAKAEVYTDWNSVEADLNGEKRDIWLINSGILKEAESLPLKEEMVCLAEERLGAREAALPHIYKYQSANVILQEMYALLAEHPTEICLRGSRKGHTIGLLSPWYDGLSLLTGLAVAQVLAEKGKVLYINTRGYCGMKLPEMEELQAAAEHTDIHGIVIDEQASTVYLKDPKMSLDVGSIGKGYAVQKVAEYAKEELGVTSMLFSVGGNVCAIGGHPDGTPWRIGIQNPDVDSDQAYLQKVSVQDVSVVTSGNYQRYYEVDGKRYCHIINPQTLLPADTFSSVTVITPDSGIADALSTTLFNMSLEEGMQFVKEQDQVEAMWVSEDGTIAYSDGFEAYLTEN